MLNSVFVNEGKIVENKAGILIYCINDDNHLTF